MNARLARFALFMSLMFGLLATSLPAAAQISVSPNVNVSRLPGNQAETAVAINPTNPLNAVVVSNQLAGLGLFEGISMDGGATWTTQIIANGDQLGFACCDPSLAFDGFGNLFLAYINSTVDLIQLGMSINGGMTWTFVGSVRSMPLLFPVRPIDSKRIPGVDQPTVTTGPGRVPTEGSVWVTYRTPAGIEARGAPVTNLGVVGSFTAPFSVPGSSSGNFGDISVGPNGEVLVTYQLPSGGAGPSTIFVNLKPDGLGGGAFGPAIIATATNVGGFRFIPAQSRRSVDAEAGLAWDRTAGPRRGRVYLVYTDAPSVASDDLDILLRISDDSGATWSAPVRVNDDPGTNSQFNPRIALDQTTGNIAVSWYDCRNDVGDFAEGDTNGIPNDDAQFWATISTDGGATLQSNVRVSAGTSNAARSGGNFDFGDYSGLDFNSGLFLPAWADNSNSTGDNPDGTLNQLDVYVAPVTVTIVPTTSGPRQLGSDEGAGHPRR